MARDNPDYENAVVPAKFEYSPEQIPFWWSSVLNVAGGATVTSAPFYTVPAGWVLEVLGVSGGAVLPGNHFFALIDGGALAFQTIFNPDFDNFFGEGAMQLTAGDTLSMRVTNRNVGASNFYYNVHGYRVRVK